MKRIAIVGSSGAGKSTLASRLGEELNLPVRHLDALYWKPGWFEPSHTEWEATVHSLVHTPEWIIDGNYAGQESINFRDRFARADTIIFLDFDRFLCLCRVLGRYLTYRGRTRPDMGIGCNEKIDFHFLRYIWRFPYVTRPKIVAAVENYGSNATLIVLKNPHEVAGFLEKLLAE